eukprot:14777238-Alexandrium_andersonii.AAC.1
MPCIQSVARLCKWSQRSQGAQTPLFDLFARGLPPKFDSFRAGRWTRLGRAAPRRALLLAWAP